MINRHCTTSRQNHQTQPPQAKSACAESTQGKEGDLTLNPSAEVEKVMDKISGLKSVVVLGLLMLVFRLFYIVFCSSTDSVLKFN